MKNYYSCIRGEMMKNWLFMQLCALESLIGVYFRIKTDVWLRLVCSFLTAMLVSSDAFADAVREVYEPDWPGRDKLIQLIEVCD